MDLISDAISNWSQIVVGFFAIYGAILSTKIWLDDKKAKTRQLAVELSPGVNVYPERTVAIIDGKEVKTPARPNEHVIYVTVKNPGEKDVFIKHYGIEFPNKNYIDSRMFDPTRVVHADNDELESGHSISDYVKVEVVQKAAKNSGLTGKINIVGYAKDALDKKYTGEPMELDLDKKYE